MQKFQGIVVYEIIINANKVILNGIYTNNGNGGRYDAAFQINNEVAKKKFDSEFKSEDDILVGKYDLRYIDSNLVNGSLVIEIINEAYKVTWNIISRKKSIQKFIGIGLKAGERHLAVSYTHI